MSAAADRPGPLIVSGLRTLTPEKLNETAQRGARGFAGLGVAPGETIATLLRNDFAFFEVMEAARLADACFVPINWHFTSEEVRYIVQDSNARILIVHADLAETAIRAAGPNTRILVVPVPEEMGLAYGLSAVQCRHTGQLEDWNAWIAKQHGADDAPASGGTIMLYTSGTTGNPKGVKRQRQDPQETSAYLETARVAFGLEGNARVVITGPLYHAAPLGYARVALRMNAFIRLMPRFDAESLLRIIHDDHISHTHVVPIMFVRLLRLPEEVRAQYDMRSLDCVLHGAAACPHDIKHQMIDWWGSVIREYYGSTEASVGCAVDSGDWLARPGTVGKPLPGVKLLVYDQDGNEAKPNQIGEIYYRQALAPDFDYLNRSPERAAIERNGLLSNGDVGYVDEDGFVYLCDRKKDMVISGGVNIYPAEVEAALITHPGVADCAVVGIPDDEFGESVHAVIQPTEPGGVDENQLIEHLNGRLARYKWPRSFEFHATLPRFDNGKVYKEKLREKHWAGRDRRI